MAGEQMQQLTREKRPTLAKEWGEDEIMETGGRERSRPRFQKHPPEPRQRCCVVAGDSSPPPRGPALGSRPVLAPAASPGLLSPSPLLGAPDQPAAGRRVLTAKAPSLRWLAMPPPHQLPRSGSPAAQTSLPGSPRAATRLARTATSRLRTCARPRTELRAHWSRLG